jgi:hypothetical protein
MNQFDQSHYRFHRRDPYPLIKFSHNTARGDHAVFWLCVAAAILLVFLP